jgi:hypothetical protein
MRDAKTLAEQLRKIQPKQNFFSCGHEERELMAKALEERLARANQQAGDGERNGE